MPVLGERRFLEEITVRIVRIPAREGNIFWLCLGAFIMLLSSLFFVVLTSQYSRASELRRSDVKTVGRIERITYRRFSSKKSIPVVHIRYTVEGKEYRNTASYATPWMRAGDKIDIYYDPQNPSQISAGAEAEFVILGIGMMLLGMSVGFLMFWAGLRGLRKE
jgi:hypothetical protein